MTKILAPRILSTCAAALLASATTGAATAEDAHTTRIVPSNSYGASVTVEEGVRVFRPFPTERHVIVNPGSRTPLSLNYYDPVTGIPVYGEARR
jgi:hypothetical protein